MDIIFDKAKLGEIIIPQKLIFDSQNDKVADRIIGHLTVKNGTSLFTSSLEKVEDSKTIVVILESPHKDEFENTCSDSDPIFVPKYAALGTTGENIKKYISKRPWVKKIEDGKYTIQLMNAIQYQMSCYNSILLPNGITGIDEVLRNRLFWFFWQHKPIVDDFISRLKKYKPAVIINACTGGKMPTRKPNNPEKHLNWLVQSEIPEQLKEKVLIDVHPSSWK